MSNLPKTMKAVVAYAPGDYRLEEIPVPVPKEGEMLIKIEACGICAGDVKAMHGAPRFWGGEDFPPYIIAPFTPGHEFVGHVAAMGANVRGDFKVGDRVVSEQIVPCMECKFCKTGRYWMCQPHDVYGFKDRVNGGMAEYMILPKNSINFKVNESIPVEKAVLIEPYSCSMHCVDRAQVGNQDVVVLAGVGTLGLGMVGAIRQRNPKKFVVIDYNDKRLALALKFGADIALNPSKDDVMKTVLDLTDGYGCDIYIEASGHPLAVKQGLDMLRKLGRFVEFSVFGSPAVIDWSVISDSKELDVLGVHLSPWCYEPVIEWIGNGTLPTDGVVTHSFSLDKWDEGFKMAENGQEALKVILKP